MFSSLLRIPTVLMGFALPDSGIHGANERLHLPTFSRGVRASIELMAHLAQSTRVREERPCGKRPTAASSKLQPTW
jgi:hypothetical protein